MDELEPFSAVVLFVLLLKNGNIPVVIFTIQSTSV